MDDGDIFEHMAVVPSGFGAQRLDVVSSGVGRRRWTREAKARIIAESMAPGVNVADVARRNDMQPQHLYMWRRKAMERVEAGGGQMFVPAMIDEELREAPALPVLAVEISIELCGLHLRVPDGASTAHIGRVLSAVLVLSNTGTS
jgi:transposase